VRGRGRGRSGHLHHAWLSCRRRYGGNGWGIRSLGHRGDDGKISSDRGEFRMPKYPRCRNNDHCVGSVAASVFARRDLEEISSEAGIDESSATGPPRPRDPRPHRTASRWRRRRRRIAGGGRSTNAFARRQIGRGKRHAVRERPSAAPRRPASEIQVRSAA
jgi:hypothetical protein